MSEALNVTNDTRSRRKQAEGSRIHKSIKYMIYRKCRIWNLKLKLSFGEIEMFEMIDDLKIRNVENSKTCFCYF